MSGVPCTECHRNVTGDTCEHCGTVQPELPTIAQRFRAALALLAETRKKAQQ